MIEQISALLDESQLIAYATAIKQTIIPEGSWKMSKQEIGPALKNPRHEAFAQALARGLSARAAYLEARYEASTTDALG